MSRYGLIFAAISCTLAGCTLRGLSERIIQDPCQSNDDCKVLNDTQSLAFDSCHPFLCVEGYCRKVQLDLDHDGFPDRACETDRARQDCDDQVATDHPGAPEVCDARDNDCDMRVDEGVLEIEHGDVVQFEPDVYATQLSFSSDLNLHTTAMVFAFDPVPSALFVNQLPSDGVRSPDLVQLWLEPTAPLTASSFVVGDVPNAATAFAAFTSDGGPHLVAALMEWPNPLLLSNAMAAQSGAHCEPEESCYRPLPQPAAAGSPDLRPPMAEPPNMPPSRALALASGSDGTLLAYLRSDTDSSVCDDGPRTSAPLLANLFATGAGGLYERSPSAIRVATTEDHGPPALLALPTTTGNDVLHGFLLAYASSNGQIVFHHVAVEDNTLVLSAPLLKLRADEGPLSAPRLALGDHEQPLASRIGLSVERGCGAERRVLFKQLTAALADDGSVKLSDGPAWLALSDADDQRAAALSWNPGRESWGVIFRDATGLNARVLDGLFTPEGSANYLLNPAVPLPPGAAQNTEIVNAPLNYHWFDIFEQVPGGVSRHILESCRR